MRTRCQRAWPYQVTECRSEIECDGGHDIAREEAVSQRQQTGPSGSGGSETLEQQHESMLSQVR